MTSFSRSLLKRRPRVIDLLITKTGNDMTKQVVFEDVTCSEAFDLAFDYMAIVEKIQTWNITNEINVIESRPLMTRMTNEERGKVSFKDEISKDQQFMKTEGQVRLGEGRRALVFNKSYGNEDCREGYRVWKIQAKNKSDEWYTSDTITIHTKIKPSKSSCYTLTIQSNSRDLADQIVKDKFPKRFGAPALFKLSKSADKSAVTVDAVKIDRHRWELQDELIDLGAKFSGSGKIFIEIPKGDSDARIMQILGIMKAMYGFDSKVSQDDSSFYIETSDYVFNKVGLTRFYEESRG